MDARVLRRGRQLVEKGKCESGMVCKAGFFHQILVGFSNGFFIFSCFFLKPLVFMNSSLLFMLLFMFFVFQSNRQPFAVLTWLGSASVELGISVKLLELQQQKLPKVSWRCRSDLVWFQMSFCMFQFVSVQLKLISYFLAQFLLSFCNVLV